MLKTKKNVVEQICNILEIEIFKPYSIDTYFDEMLPKSWITELESDEIEIEISLMHRWFRPCELNNGIDWANPTLITTQIGQSLSNLSETKINSSYEEKIIKNMPNIAKKICYYLKLEIINKNQKKY